MYIITLCLSIHPLMDIWVVSTFLAIVNNAARNMGVQISVGENLKKSVLLSIHPEPQLCFYFFIIIFFYFFWGWGMPRGIWDLSSLTRDQTLCSLRREHRVLTTVPPGKSQALLLKLLSLPVSWSLGCLLAFEPGFCGSCCS